MRPTCFNLGKKDHQFQLYMMGLSTLGALGMFAPSTPLTVTEFEADKTKRGYNGWISAKDLPSLVTAGLMFDYLNTNNKIDIIDFTATINQDTVLSTHDDNEACFLVPSDERAIGILEALVDKELLATVLPTILSNPGKYIGEVDGKFSAYASFSDWVNARTDKREAT